MAQNVENGAKNFLNFIVTLKNFVEILGQTLKIMSGQNHKTIKIFRKFFQKIKNFLKNLKCLETLKNSIPVEIFEKIEHFQKFFLMGVSGKISKISKNLKTLKIQ